MTGDNLYAWQVQEPDGRWSMVAVSLRDDMSSAMPLIHRDLQFILRTAEYAERHAGATGQPLRLAHFELHAVIGPPRVIPHP